MEITTKKVDITELEVDAIVNAANSYGYMGGGIAGVIKRKGGIEIEREAVSKAPIPIGYAILTKAGKLKAKYVIHSPTMEQPASLTDINKIKEATRAALECADENNLKVIAMPGMGTGVGGVPKNKAAKAMIESINNFKAKVKNLKEIILVDIKEDMIKAFEKAIKENKI